MKYLAATRPLRIGVLGCSDIACRRFLPALRQSQKGELIAVGTRARYASQERLGAYHCAIVSYEELLQRNDIELIYLSLPNHLHEEWTLRALAAGKHVLCEKPLGLDAAAVKRMHAVAAERNRLLYENIMYLQHPQHAAVKAVVTSGRIGRLRALRATFTIPALPVKNFRNDPERGGGAFHDQIRYPLSAASYFLSGEKYVFQGKMMKSGELVTAMHGGGVTEQKEIFRFSIGFGLPYHSTYELKGDAGRIRVERAFTTPADLANKIVLSCAGRDESFILPAADHFLLTINHVCDLVAQPKLFAAIRAQNERLATLADDLYRSCHAG